MITINYDLCSGCCRCVSDCLTKVIRIEDQKPVVTRECKFLCGHCVGVCPENAVSISEYDMSEVVHITPHSSPVDPEALLLAMKSRRSVRHFTKEQVSEEHINNIIEAARYCPTGGNKQAVKLILVQDKVEELVNLSVDILGGLAEDPDPAIRPEAVKTYGKAWGKFKERRERGEDPLFFHAPSVLIFAGTDGVDPSLAAAYAELEAFAQGVSSLYVGFFRTAALAHRMKEFIGLEPGEKVYCTLALGYADVSFHNTVPRFKKEVRRL